MDRFEEELASALRRKDPPPGLEREILAKLSPPRPKRRAWIWLTVAASCLIVLLSGIQYERRREERIAGAIAKQQVLEALRIARGKLGPVEEQLTAMERKSLP